MLDLDDVPQAAAGIAENESQIQPNVEDVQVEEPGIFLNSDNTGTWDKHI